MNLTCWSRISSGAESYISKELFTTDIIGVLYAMSLFGRVGVKAEWEEKARFFSCSFVQERDEVRPERTGKRTRTG
jgi:hypothetical protein